MELHAFRYPNLHSAILGEIFSIRFQPHQAVAWFPFDAFQFNLGISLHVTVLTGFWAEFLSLKYFHFQAKSLQKCGEFNSLLAYQFILSFTNYLFEMLNRSFADGIFFYSQFGKFAS